MVILLTQCLVISFAEAVFYAKGAKLCLIVIY